MSEVFKISKDERRARALKDMAKDRFSSVNNLKEPYRIVEEYYEIIKELITSLMYSQGLKTLSHKSLVEFADKSIKFLTKKEIGLKDELRIVRNNIVYYREKITLDFLKSREENIKIIITKFFD